MPSHERRWKNGSRSAERCPADFTGGIEMKRQFAMFTMGMMLSASLVVPAYANAPFESPTLQIVRDNEAPPVGFHPAYSFIEDFTAETSYCGFIFEAKGDDAPLWDAEIIQPEYIVISVETAGTLKEGKKLYFKVENLRFDKFLAVDLLEGDAAFDYAVNDDGWLELTILKAGTTPAKLKVHQMAVVMGEQRREATLETTKYAYSYPLVLVTDPAAPDNLFSAEENVLLAPHFAVQQQPSMELYYAGFAYDKFTAGERCFSYNGKQYPLSHPCFLRDGVLMVPLKECMAALSGGEKIGMEWDARTKTVFWGNIFSVSAETDTRTNRESKPIPLKYPAALKDNTLYISFRDFIDIAADSSMMGRPTGEFYWNAKLKTASYRGKRTGNT